MNKHGYWDIPINEFSSYHYFDNILSKEIACFIKTMNIKKIYDFGCGSGEYVNFFIKNDIIACGFDGNPYTNEIENCECLDLVSNIQLEPVDLILCLEVGEHIPEIYEDILINNIKSNLTKNGILILSWAIPGQGGCGHVNEQTNDYVKETLSKNGFINLIEQENIFRKKCELVYFPNTLMVFKKL